MTRPKSRKKHVRDRESGEARLSLGRDRLATWLTAKARAKITYERLINHTDDRGSKDAHTYLMTREITHMKSFGAGLESFGKGPYEVSELRSNESEVDVYDNDSTGEGDLGSDSTGPWSEGGNWKKVDDPAFAELPR